jgi:hypothetical protein
MTFAIHGSKNGERVVTVRIGPDAAVDKARLLESFVGKFILQTRLGTSLTFQNLIDFVGSIEGSPDVSRLEI